jgi:hypothetical protein
MLHEKWVTRLQEADADPLLIASEMLREMGARNSKSDLALIQTIHDHSVAMGAGCTEPDSDDKKEAAAVDVIGDVVPLREGAVGQDGTAYLKLIAPGWGSSGYYSADVLARDGAKAFPAGTKNFWNHQTAAEESARPEGDLRDLASVLTEDARYDANGPAGAGLYAKATVQPHYREHVDSMAKHIGMSIRASGRAKEGKAEGKAGPIIEQLTRGISVDYVTTPGAGGKILQLFEAARGSRSQSEGETDMDEAQVKRLIETATAPLLGTITTLTAETTRLTKQLAEAERSKVGRAAVEELLEGIKLPKASKTRIADQLSGAIPVTEAGVIDTLKLKEAVERAAKDKATELQELGFGQVQGLGASEAPGELKEADVQKEAVDVFTRLTGNPKIAEISAKGRAA